MRDSKTLKFINEQIMEYEKLINSDIFEQVNQIQRDVTNNSTLKATENYLKSSVGQLQLETIKSILPQLNEIRKIYNSLDLETLALINSHRVFSSSHGKSKRSELEEYEDFYETLSEESPEIVEGLESSIKEDDKKIPLKTKDGSVISISYRKILVICLFFMMISNGNMVENVVKVIQYFITLNPEEMTLKVLLERIQENEK